MEYSSEHQRARALLIQCVCLCVPIFTCVFTCVCFLSPTKQNPKHTPSREARHITVGRVHPLWGMLYADDACIVSRSLQGLAKMMEVIVEVCRAFALTVSAKKTETMCNSMFARLGTDYERRNQWFFAILKAITTD